MYEYLEGTPASRSPARLVLDVNGVGYDLAVPIGASFAASGRLRVWTHLVVREDAHQLYGFPDREAREIFRALLSVRGVGPVLALSILSGLAPHDLLDAVAAADAKALTRIRGVGRKTAEQILLDLGGRVDKLRTGLAAPAGAAAPRPAAAARDRNVEDAVTALISIGYSEKEARASVDRASKSADPSNLEQLVRAALASP